MTPRDYSQVPVEQLARLLLERARTDSGLPRRTPANTNEPPPGWSVPPEAQPCRPWFPDRLAEQPRFAGQERIEDLVSQAMAAAQEAEDIARAASRRANRGAAVAMALGVFGALAGVGAGVGSLLCDTGARPPVQAAQAADPVQPAAATAAAIAGQTELAQPAAMQAEPDDGSALSQQEPPALAPATFVRVLPAVPSLPSYGASDDSGWAPAAPPPRDRVGPQSGFGRVLGTLRRLRTG
ncbi:MAG TPA: hypothetical protein VFN42_13010 [Acetobacteraceae bacterium]|nr:hypothetical protein [Acetobacteraceae bacterium]